MQYDNRASYDILSCKWITLSVVGSWCNAWRIKWKEQNERQLLQKDPTTQACSAWKGHRGSETPRLLSPVSLLLLRKTVRSVAAWYDRPLTFFYYGIAHFISAKTSMYPRKLRRTRRYLCQNIFSGHGDLHIHTGVRILWIISEIDDRLTKNKHVTLWQILKVVISTMFKLPIWRDRNPAFFSQMTKKKMERGRLTILSAPAINWNGSPAIKSR